MKHSQRPALVSVIIPTHNRAQLLVQAIDSVLAQSYPHIEIIVIDDSSTDNTQELLKPYLANPAITYIQCQEKSSAGTRNMGLSHATGEYIAFLDSDDLFLPQKIEAQIALLQDNPQIGLVHTGLTKFTSAGQNLGYRDNSTFQGNVYPKILLTWSALITISTVVTPRHVLDEVGLFDPHLYTAEDLDMWRRIARRYPIYCIPETLTLIRVHDGNISGDRKNQIRSFHPYLTKAFNEDPELDARFRTRALTRMYNAAGRRLLGDPTLEASKLIREYAAISIQKNPFQGGPYLNYLASWLPRGILNALYGLWLRLRYPRRGIVSEFFPLS